MNFFQRLFDNIGKFFRKIFAKAKIFLNKEIPTAIHVVELIKEGVNSPFLPLLNALIPGQVDDVIAAKIKEALPDILVKLKIADECARLGSNDEIIQCAVKHLKEYHPLAQHAYYLNIASMLSAALTDNKLSWSEIIILVQYTYDNKFKK